MLSRRLWLGCILGAVPALFQSQLPAAGPEWRTALPGWNYEFPADHGPHRAFKTEWWYFTGNLSDDDGHRYGYQFTLFRQGVRPPGGAPAGKSRFLVDAFYFGHFAVSEFSGGRFHFSQKLSRGAFGEAGDGDGSRLVWLEDWSVEQLENNRFRIRASMEAGGLVFDLESGRGWVVLGGGGISPKSDRPGHASHYYSGTRMKTAGELSVGGKVRRVSGESWFDHEWASNQLAPGQVGWNWMSIQLSDGSDLMLYQMRLRDGGVDSGSNGTWIRPDGSSVFLKSSEYQMRPLRYWKSPQTGACYPVEWEVEVPSMGVRIRVSTPMEKQELVMQPVVYWEGAVEASGSAMGAPVSGRGYLEMTGYAGALVGLTDPAGQVDGHPSRGSTGPEQGGQFLK
ncbi:MAG: hypothetical protein RLZZ253_105 [Verrucomicrobiota bacterium]